MALKPPEHLSPARRAIWEEIAPSFNRRIGAAGLEAVCTVMQRLRDAQERIDREGLIVADSRGKAISHPAIEVERKLSTELRGWVEKFGSRPPREDGATEQD